MLQKTAILTPLEDQAFAGTAGRAQDRTHQNAVIAAIVAGMTELLARITALGRRGRAEAAETATRLSHRGLDLDLLSQTCACNGTTVLLNPKEFRLLEVLMRSKGRIQTRAMLLERVWDINFDPSTSVVETHMSRLRNKIEKPFGLEFIKTVRGSGYMFID